MKKVVALIGAVIALSACNPVQEILPWMVQTPTHYAPADGPEDICVPTNGAEGTRKWSLNPCTLDVCLVDPGKTIGTTKWGLLPCTNEGG